MNDTITEIQRATRQYEYVNGTYQLLNRAKSAEAILTGHRYTELPTPAMAFRTYQQTASRNFYAYAILVQLPRGDVLIFCRDQRMYLSWCKEYGCAVAILDQLLPDR